MPPRVKLNGEYVYLVMDLSIFMPACTAVTSLPMPNSSRSTFKTKATHGVFTSKSLLSTHCLVPAEHPVSVVFIFPGHDGVPHALPTCDVTFY